MCGWTYIVTSYEMLCCLSCYGLFGGIYGIYECKFVYFVCCENSKQWFSSVKSKCRHMYKKSKHL